MSAPGVTVAIREIGGAAALEAYAFSLKYIWIVSKSLILFSAGHSETKEI